MFRKAIISLTIILFSASPAMADGVKVTAAVPPGIDEVSLMSQGAYEMLRYIRLKYESQIKGFEVLYKISDLKKEVDNAVLSSRNDSDTVAMKVQAIRNEYIPRLSIVINKVKPFISPASSATGEVEFTYTATNNSDRIIADIVYTPMAGNMEIQTPAKQVLDFVDRVTLKAGIAPGKTLTTTEAEPDSFSFLIGQLSKIDLVYIRENIEKGLSLKIKDIHFTNSIEYKDQSKVLTVEEAFPARLKDLVDRNKSESRLAQENLDKYKKAQEGFEAEKSKSLLEFKRAAGGLKKSAVRYSSKADRKGRAVFKEVLPGNYFIYGVKDGQAVFKEISVKNSRLKIKALELQKDPFKP
jgi:hypothetical protein